MSEFDDEYTESLETEFRKLEGALLNDTVRLLTPSEPLRLTAEHSVARAIQSMVQNRRAAVVIVDEHDRLIGIFTERDVLTRVLGAGRVARDTLLREVMTADPETLRSDDRICFAINRMHAGGFRSLPLVDNAHRPIGIACAIRGHDKTARIGDERLEGRASHVLRSARHEFLPVC